MGKLAGFEHGRGWGRRVASAGGGGWGTGRAVARMAGQGMCAACVGFAAVQVCQGKDDEAETLRGGRARRRTHRAGAAWLGISSNMWCACVVRPGGG
ncbi:hypothetical protein E2562_021858 [Oryza meyeriana var. granulata]|uniref:Uncharacterized protein n=1 Tax=Oryza meyeriana var. granulata TaxID=110450 RepID=A0A6G1C8G3_9ORYZ|nr:hypothetical protein E2562_021858 [Oryza meyeriana var. granulata]